MPGSPWSVTPVLGGPLAGLGARSILIDMPATWPTRSAPTAKPKAGNTSPANPTVIAASAIPRAINVKNPAEKTRRTERFGLGQPAGTSWFGSIVYAFGGDQKIECQT